MASFKKTGTGWRAFVARRGVRTSKILPTKRDAQDWAARQEHLILEGEGRYGPGTLGNLLDRYAREVSPGKKGARWEEFRLANMATYPIAKIDLKKLRPGDFAAWRDDRAKKVSPGTVIREMNLLSAVLNRAVREWDLLPSNPLTGVSRPKQPQARNRLPTADEVTALIAAAPKLSTARGRSVHAFRFAMATAMRAGEICSLTEASITGSVAHLPDTKNGRARNVPLSAIALDLWAALPGDGFEMTPDVLSTSFRQVRTAAKITGLTFHDSRHAAITAMARKVHVLALARIVGHSNVAQLQTYYNETAEDLARLLD